ncbi:MAG: glycosyltransferase family 4 protein [Actinomycetota bacterium]
MKVAVVCPYAWDRFGGVQTHVRALVTSLRGRGHDAVAIAPTYEAKVPPEEGVVFAGRAVRVPANRSVAPISFGPFGAVALRKALGRDPERLVHLHEPLIPSLSLVALWNARGPRVGTFHASAESNPLYAAAKPALARAIDRLAVRCAVSTAARDHVARYFPGDYELTPNGVAGERYRVAPAADLGTGPTVLFLGRIEDRKGLDVLIKALARIDEVGATLVVAGAGPEAVRCRSLAGRLGVRTRFLGRVDEDLKPGVFRAADVYCAPALGGESFGIVLLEAMAAGTPVVCSSLPGFREAAGDAARFVPPGDPYALSEALRSLLRDDAERARCAVAGERRAGAFDWERLVVQVEDVYARAVAAHGTSSGAA